MKIYILDYIDTRTQQGKIEKIKSSFLKNEIIHLKLWGCGMFIQISTLVFAIDICMMPLVF